MKSCSFFGHRDTPQTEELKERVREIVERLIVEENVDTFLFGSRSKFDDLCHIVVKQVSLFNYANTLQKTISEQGFDAHRLQKDEIKRLLALYFDVSMRGECMPDVDGAQFFAGNVV